ncbi:hypothetical protein [Acinetobacter johnsonii]|uniref:hypothetical protein n=1 Tax=Acinetobacter TaxID=469 RepID=UPI0032B3A593
MATPFNEFIEKLHKDGQLDDYALRVGTSSQYLFTHLKHRRKIPNKCFMQILALESKGEFTFQDLVLWFYDLKTA